METTTINNTTIETTLTVGDAVEVTLHDRRAESLDFFTGIAEAQRGLVAADVWTIGLRAIQTAQASANAARLEDVGGTILEGLRERLTEHVAAEKAAIEGALRGYFDPSDGRLMARLDALFRDEGQLVGLLKRHTGDGSTLAATLSERIAPLVRALDPGQRDGIAQNLTRQVEAALKGSERSVAAALDPAVGSSAAGRFMAELRREIAAAGETQERRLAAATTALDANNPDSLLSRLLRETQEAQARVLAAVSPGSEGSLLGPLQRSLTEMLEAHQRQNAALLEGQRQGQEVLARELREAVVRIEQRRENLRRGAAAGRAFEGCVYDFASRVLSGGPVVVEFTGTKAAANRRKVGDVVLTFTEESAFAGAKVVIEAKCEAGSSVTKALAELKEARTNRGAEIGVFVLSKSAAPEAFPAFGRYGQDVLVVWDSEDPATDAYLHGALLVGMMLASRRAKAGDVDQDASLEAALRGLDVGLKAMGEIEKQAQAVATAARKLADEVARGKEALAGSMRSTRAVLDARSSGRADSALEAASPIVGQTLLGAEGLEGAARSGAVARA